MSLSKATYDFWKDETAKKNSGSDLFQTPAPKSESNIMAKANGSLPVKGIFSACSIRKKVI
jgi:hypothetical protein